MAARVSVVQMWWELTVLKRFLINAVFVFLGASFWSIKISKLICWLFNLSAEVCKRGTTGDNLLHTQYSELLCIMSSMFSNIATSPSSSAMISRGLSQPKWNTIHQDFKRKSHHCSWLEIKMVWGEFTYTCSPGIWYKMKALFLLLAAYHFCWALVNNLLPGLAIQSQQ